MHRPRGRNGSDYRAKALCKGLGAPGGSQINPADHVACTGLVVALVMLVARPCAKGSGSIFLNLAVDRLISERHGSSSGPFAAALWL